MKTGWGEQSKAIPQGLKPNCCPSPDVGAKAPTPSTKHLFPQTEMVGNRAAGLPPTQGFGGRADGRPQQIQLYFMWAFGVGVKVV